MDFHKIYSLLIILIFATGTSSAAEVYRWTDENGKVHFGDQPPQQGAEEIHIKTPTPASESSTRARLDRQQKLLDSFAEEREVKAKDQKKKVDEKARREKKCRIARDRAERYRTSGYLYHRDKEGKKIILSHEQRAEAEKKAQAEVARLCR